MRNSLFSPASLGIGMCEAQFLKLIRLRKSLISCIKNVQNSAGAEFYHSLHDLLLKGPFF